MNTKAMSCTTLDERLADYLEGQLTPPSRKAIEAHLASCLRCAALVRDLEQIRGDAATLGELAPARDLWDGIAARIEAPVIPLAAPPPRTSRRAWSDRVRLAAVAAGLVAVTAGVTYTLTMAGNSRSPAVQPPIARSAPVASDSPVVAASDSIDQTSDAPNAQLAGGTDRPGPAERPREPERAGPAVQTVGSAPLDLPQSREIDRLRAVFAENKYRLEPRTAAIIETNLKVIDQAIEESRAALAQDPASRFLSQQLSTTLDKKLELLRTAARLPNRT